MLVLDKDVLVDEKVAVDVAVLVRVVEDVAEVDVAVVVELVKDDVRVVVRV